MNNGLQFESKKNYGSDKSADYVAYPSADQLFPNSTALGAELLRKLPAYAAQVASANGNITKARDIYRFFKIQWDLIFKDEIPVAEILLSAAFTFLPQTPPRPLSLTPSTSCWTLISTLRHRRHGLFVISSRLSHLLIWLVPRSLPAFLLLLRVRMTRPGLLLFTASVRASFDLPREIWWECHC